MVVVPPLSTSAMKPRPGARYVVQDSVAEPEDYPVTSTGYLGDGAKSPACALGARQRLGSGLRARFGQVARLISQDQSPRDEWGE